MQKILFMQRRLLDLTRFYGFSIILLFLILSGCASDKAASGESDATSVRECVPEFSGRLNSDRSNLNISILLDLSDRINDAKYPNSAMPYYKRDVGYIKSIYDYYLLHCTSKTLNSIDDRIKVYVEPEPASAEANKILNDLKHELSNLNITSEVICEISKSPETIESFYESSIAKGNFPGSDVWGFIKNKANTFCIEDGYRNVLFIVSDGYFYHSKNKRQEGNRTSYLIPQDLKARGLDGPDYIEKINSEGLGYIVPVGVDLGNLEVYVIGIDGHEANPYAEDILREYIERWFIDMKVSNIDMQNSILPTEMDNWIRDRILLEKR